MEWKTSSWFYGLRRELKKRFFVFFAGTKTWWERRGNGGAGIAFRHQEVLKLKRQFLRQEKKMHCRRGKSPAQITSIECVVCKVWIAPLAILTLCWSVGHTTLRADSLTSVVGKKKLFPQASSRAFRLSLCSWTLLTTTTTHTHKTQKEEKKKKTNKKISKSKKPCVHMWASACWCVCLC